MNPLLTVGIPTYNGARYVLECLDSILQQTLADYEVIVVDDRSTDETYEIAGEYVGKDSRIRLFRNEKRLGLVGNFNRCLALAKGKYVCIFGQDDVMMPENLAKKVDVLEASPNVGFVHSNIYQVNSKGEVTSEHGQVDSTRDYLCYGPEYFHKLILSRKNLVCCPSVLMRKECYDRLGGFLHQLHYTCDWEMWMRISLYHDVACVALPLIKYRRHPQSETDRVLNTPFRINQIYLAKKSILINHQNRIPHARRLKREVKTVIAREALDKALSLFYEENFPESRRFLALAIKINPELLSKGQCIRLLLRLALGPRGVQACRYLKSTFRSS